MDARGRDLDSWEEAVKKAINAKTKALLQSSFSIRDIDSCYSQRNKPAKKEEKDSGGENKSTDSVLADTSSGNHSIDFLHPPKEGPKPLRRPLAWKGTRPRLTCNGRQCHPKKRGSRLLPSWLLPLQKEGLLCQQVSSKEETGVKKLVLVLATSTWMTGAREEALKRDLCIHYPVQFSDTNKAHFQALINLESEVNAIYPTFAKQLSLSIRPTNVRA